MEEVFERRRRPDPRRVGPRAFLGVLGGGRRRMPRRRADRRRFHYVDRFEPAVLGLCVGILLCSIGDAVLTLRILEAGGTELNPVMARLIEWHEPGFVAIKYAITAVCLLLLVAHIRFQLAGRVSVKQLLGAILIGYVALINYELLILFG